MGSRWGMSRTERFWQKVTIRSDYECWPWNGFVRRGYGVMWMGTRRGDRRTKPAHRYAYEQMHGPIPSWLVMDHLCRNTTCVNPAHLEPVTIGENTKRGAAAQTECKYGHPRRMERPAKKRECLECKRLRNAVYQTCRRCGDSHSSSQMRRDGDGWVCSRWIGCGRTALRIEVAA